MKEGKPYPKPEEEDGNGMTASEPAAAVAERTSWINADSSIFEEIINSDCSSPRTIEELIAEIDYSESVEDDPDEWVTSEQVRKEVKELFPWAKIG